MVEEVVLGNSSVELSEEVSMVLEECHDISPFKLLDSSTPYLISNMSLV